MKYASLFAGIGGFDLALNRGGYECAYVNEWDKYAAQTYEKNFGHRPDARDITTVSTDDIPDHDILVGGFPCQSFSIAGKRGGFNDTRGTLFFEIARILAAKRPSYLLLENVKGLLNHDSGRTFQTIMWALDELGYELQWQVLNSKNFGVPQNRERVFIIGNLRAISRPKIFPLTQSHRGHYVGCIQASYYKGWHEGSYVESEEKLEGSKRSTESKPVIISRHPRPGDPERGGTGPLMSTEHSFTIDRAPHTVTTDCLDYEDENLMMQQLPDIFDSGNMVALTETRTDEAKAIRRENMKKGKDWSPRRGKVLTPRQDSKANTVTASQNKEGLLTDGTRLRKLTPVECERLQGFPDNWTAGVSDTQRYRQLGNAVTVNVVEAIINKL